MEISPLVVIQLKEILLLMNMQPCLLEIMLTHFLFAGAIFLSIIYSS